MLPTNDATLPVFIFKFEIVLSIIVRFVEIILEEDTFNVFKLLVNKDATVKFVPSILVSLL